MQKQWHEEKNYDVLNFQIQYFVSIYPYKKYTTAKKLLLYKHIILCLGDRYIRKCANFLLDSK